MYPLKSILLSLMLLCAASASGGVTSTPEQAVAAPGIPAAETPADTVTPAVPDGKYIYVPDSLQRDVLLLLEGHSKVVDDLDRLNPDEMTIHNGDTIPMVLRQLNLGRHDRGLSNFLYIPRGVWSIGLTASYGEIDTKELEIFDLLSDVNVNAHAFSIKPYLQYFIKNNMAVGMKFGYTNAEGNIDSFKVDIDDDMNFNLHDIVYKAETYSASFTFTQFIGLARRSRFGVFNEIELAFASGNSDFTRPYNNEPRSTHTTTMSASLNFSPGLQVFMMKNVAFHISFGVFGFSLKNEKQKENGVETGNRFTSGANFRFNIFNINFGLAVTL